MAGGLAWLALAAQPAPAQYSVFPVIVELEAPYAAAVTPLNIRNEGDELLQLRLYVVDFDQMASGEHKYFAPGTHRRSCADRLSVTPDAISVPAGAKAVVTLRMEAGGEGVTCWSMVFAESAGRSPSGVRITERIGVKAYGVPGETMAIGGIERAVVASSDSGRRLEFEFANPGAGPLRPEGLVEIRRMDGSLAWSEAVDAFSVLPGAARRVLVDLPVLPEGRYLAMPILDFGGEFLAGAQVDFVVP